MDLVWWSKWDHIAIMETLSHDTEPNPEKMLEYTYSIYELMDELEVSKDTITEEMVEVGAEMFTRMYERYGNPESKTYMMYHNDKHAFDVLRRYWIQVNLSKELFPDEHSEIDYVLGFFASPGHDLVRGTNGPKGEDERQSSLETCQDMRRLGMGEDVCTRVDEMIMTTEVETENGTVTQTTIRSGNKDTLRLKLAIADINGIAMEGIPTMVRDSLNLCLEVHNMTVNEMIKNPEIIDKFFVTQAKFVEERLQALEGDFEYYYGDKAQLVAEAYEAAFTGATRHAKGAANVIYRFPVIRKKMIEDALAEATAHDGSEAEKLVVIQEVCNEWLTRLTPVEAEAQLK